MGVTLVSSERKRFVVLNGGRLPAAICSEPIEVLPGAHYTLRVERALPGECQLALISRERVIEPDLSEEVVPQESPVRIQVTAPTGKKVGVSRVALEPVGYRLKIQSVRSTYMFVPPGTPFEILCDLKNTGSEPIRSALATLYSDSLQLSEEYRHTLSLPEIPVGDRVTGRWLVLKQTKALATFQIEIQYEGGVTTTTGVTLKHTPRLPSAFVLPSIAGGARWFSVGSRGLRVTAHETDLDFGPLLVSLDKGKNSQPAPLGVLHHIAQLVAEDGTRYPLWARLKRRSHSGIELAGKNTVAEWRLLLTPEHAERGIAFRLHLRILRRLATTPGAPPTAWIEFGPFQTVHTLALSGGLLEISGTREGKTQKVPFMRGEPPMGGGPPLGENWEPLPVSIELAWGASGPAPSRLEADPDSGIATLILGPLKLIPGTSCAVSTLLQIILQRPDSRGQKLEGAQE